MAKAKGNEKGAAAAAAAVVLPMSSFLKVLGKGPSAKLRKPFKLSKVRLPCCISYVVFCSALLYFIYFSHLHPRYSDSR